MTTSRMNIVREPIRKKRVSFNSQVKVIKLPRSSRNVWYQRDDFISFYKEGMSTIKALKFPQNVSTLDPSEYCLRGLEKKISKSYEQQRRKYQSDTTQMILHAHALQRQTGKIEPEKIKTLSMMFSRRSRERALEIAEIDAKASLSIVYNAKFQC
mmetsp:Transcript_33101/g.49970  ORF Transcript_33101/g.49970 Transcript_33101/m.49970 type:complete len:155 (-) Transcript_33101:21-485(-)